MGGRLAVMLLLAACAGKVQSSESPAVHEATPPIYPTLAATPGRHYGWLLHTPSSHIHSATAPPLTSTQLTAQHVRPLLSSASMWWGLGITL